MDHIIRRIMPMSHYQIMAVVRPGGPSLEEIMAPYSEHLTVDPYVYRTKAQTVEKARAQIEQARKDLAHYKEVGEVGYLGQYDLRWLLEGEWGPKFAAADPTAPDDELFEAFKDYYGDPKDYDADGNLISTYNPNARWDYWSEGSSLSVVLKDGTEADEARAVEIDWKATDSPKRGERAEYLRTWRVLALGKAPNGLEGEALEKWLDEEYGPLRPRIGYLKEAYGSFEAFLRAETRFAPYAVADPDGWHAPGRVGWFGCSTDTPEQYANWLDVELPAIIAALGPDDEIHLLDCHI
jgi:hypothetical protein